MITISHLPSGSLVRIRAYIIMNDLTRPRAFNDNYWKNHFNHRVSEDDGSRGGRTGSYVSPFHLQVTLHYTALHYTTYTVLHYVTVCYSMLLQYATDPLAQSALQVVPPPPLAVTHGSQVEGAHTLYWGHCTYTAYSTLSILYTEPG